MTYTAPDATLQPVAPLQIPEPKEGIIFNPKQLDVVFIPLLIFDLKGYRVGYGKGFYDRFLSECKSEVLKVGLSFFDPVDKIIDIRSEDIKMDFCVNSEGIKKFTS